MKIERMRQGIVVLNKIDGKRYKVCGSFDSAVGTPSGVAYELADNDPNDIPCGELVNRHSVEITEANALAFRVLADTEPYPVPVGYIIRNGILMKNGEPVCAQGEIVIDKILATQADSLILAANKDEVDGRVDIMTYKVSRDRFTTLLQHTVMPKFVGSLNDCACFIYSETHTEEIPNDRGELEKIEIFDSAGAYTVKNGTIVYTAHPAGPINVEKAVIKAENEEANPTYFLPLDKFVDNDDKISDANAVSWYAPTIGAQFDTKAYDLDINYSHIYKTWVVKTKDEVFVLGRDFHVKSKEITKLEGYDHLIDITKAEYRYDLTFSNDEYEFKKLVSQSTRDRGYIVTVE